MATVATPAESSTRVPSYDDERESTSFQQKSTTSTLANIITVVRRTWLLGFVSFGGPAVHIILLRKKFVEGIEPWMDSKTFADLFALSAALPGPGSTQLLFSMALLKGGGIAGLLAFTLWSLPGAVGMLALSLAVSRIPSVLPPLVLATLTGLNAAAVGLIVVAGAQLTKMTATDRTTKYVLFGSAAIGTCYTAIWLFPVLTIGGGVVTLLVDWSGWQKLGNRIESKRESRREAKLASKGSDDGIALDDMRTTGRESDEIEEIRHEEESTKSANTISVPSLARLPTPPPDDISTTVRRRTGSTPVAPAAEPPLPVAEAKFENNFHLTIFQSALVLAFFFGLLIAIVVLRATLANPGRPLEIFTSLFIAGSILFGGGPVVIPLLQTSTVDSGWMSSRDFLIGFAVLQAFPGPNFNFSVFVGALSLPSSPVLGGLLGYLGLFSPGLFLKFALLPTYSRFRDQPQVRSTLRGLNAAASGLVWTAVYRLWVVGLLTASGQPASLERSGYWVAVAGGAYAVSVWDKLAPQYVILSGAIFGLIYGGVIGSP